MGATNPNLATETNHMNNPIVPIPYSPTLTRAQFLTEELVRAGLTEYHADYKRLLEDKRPLLKDLWDVPIAFGVPEKHQAAMFNFYIDTFREDMAYASAVLMGELEAKGAAVVG